MTPYLFNKIDIARTYVFGKNLILLFLCAAAVIGSLLVIGNLPSTGLGFRMFVAVMHGEFIFIVFSQLTTGHLLDAIAPGSQIGCV